MEEGIGSLVFIEAAWLAQWEWNRFRKIVISIAILIENSFSADLAVKYNSIGS